MRDRTIEDVQDELDVNRQTVYRWIRLGLPCDEVKEGRRSSKRFDINEVAAWMKEKGLTGEQGRPAGPMSEQLLAVRTRKEAAMASLHELKLQREQGQLVEKAQVEKDNVAKFTVIRNKLLGMPAALAATLVGRDAPAIEREIEHQVREALAELSRQ